MSDGPPERDVKDFKFQELCKLRVSDPIEIRTDRSQWLAASHKFDLVFIGIKDGFKVFKLSDICRMDEENARDRSTHIVEDFPAWAGVSLANPVSHLSLSCDELTLAVVLKECGNLTLCMYDVRQFAVKIDNPLVFARTRLNASPGASLQDITWNPVDPTLLAVCVSDGSVELVKVTDKIQTVGSLPVSSNACCFCWSPKGRQLVVARKDGTMTQFDQELKEKRNWPMPTILDNTCQVVDVTWLSTYVFLAAYLPNTAESSDQPVVILTVSSKEGPTSYVNFDDVCYGSGEDRKHKYFFTYLAKWELVVLSSSNATETTVIAKHFDQTPTSAQWEHWTLEDSGRAELPLTDNQLDSFPVGATVSLASQTPIVLGENKSHPASPVILLLSTDGLLVPYYLMYLHPQAVALTVPQEQLKLADARTSTGATDSNQSAATGSSTTMPGFQLGAQKTASFGTSLGQSSTLPTTGSSFQFVQKTSQPTPTIPGASLLSQSKTSSLPTTGNSFQFVAKPTQTAPAAPGHNLFTPVGSQAANIPSSGSQKSGTSFPFTPPTPGTISSPAATKQPQSSTAVAPSGGQTTKNLFAAPTPGGSAFSSGAAGPSRTTAPSFGFGTEPARTTAPSFGFSTEPAKPSAGTAGSVAGFGGTASSQAFSFSKSSATPSDTSSAATSTASTFGGFSFAQTAETPSTFGVAARPGVGGFVGVSQTSQSASTVAPSTTTVRPAQTSTPSLGQTSTPSLGQTSTSSLGQTSSPSLGQTSSVTPLAARGDESKVVELPTPTYPVSRPSHSTPTSSTLTGGIAGVKRDIEGETGQLSPTPPPSMDKTWVNQTVESTFTRSIIEEMHHFEQELKELKSRAGSGVAQVGSREEMQSLRKTTMEMETFCQEVKDTTREQSREVHDQKVLCLDLFAMTEECRVRQERNDDPQYHQLLRSRALDPASSEKLKQLQSQYQVQEQGLMEVELILDQQWEEYQDRKKAVKGRLQAPTSDMIYRTVKSNHNLIQSQKSHLENLQEKLKNLQLYNQSSDWQNTSTFSPNTTRTTDLTSLVNSLGQGTPRPVMTSSVIIVSPEKKAQLRDFLSHRAVPRVKSTKPGNLSMSRIVAAKGLREKLEEVRSRPSPGAPPGPDTDQTVPLQLVTRPGAGQSQQGRGFVKVSLTGACLSQLGQDTQTDPIRGIQNKSSSFLPAMRGSLPRGEGSDSLASSTNSFGKGVSSEELTSAMLRAKEMMGTTSLGGSLRPDIEDISPAFTPELASDEQEGFTEEDEGGEYDEEEEEDEDETGFGPEYSLDMTAHGMKAQVDNNMSSGTPLSSNLTSATNDKKSGLGKNLFGSSAVSTSTLSSQPTSGSTGGFTFNNEPGKSGLAGKPLFGSGSVTTKPADVTSSSQDNAAVKSEMRGFSFGTKPSAGDKSASSGFSFTMPGSNADTSGASGFKFGAEGGIFSKPSESSKPTGSSFSAFGGGSFGGGGEISSTTATSSTSSETAAAVTAALNNSLLQALTDSSTSVTSASVTASAALGSSLLAALTDASSPAPQEAAAALSSFSFKPGETPSPPSTNTGTSALVVSGSAVTAGSETSESGSTTATTLTVLSQVTSSTESVTPAVGLFGQTTSSAAGSFGQPAKFSGSPPCATTATTATTTSASLFGSSSGALGSTGPSSFGALSTPTTTATGITSTTTASVVKTLFGQPSTTTTASSVFGTTTTASAVTPSGFGTAATTSSTVPTASSIFGGSTVTTTASAFGHPSSTTTTPSLFGGETTSSTTPSVFGGGTTASTNPSVFGGGATTGVFAAQATTTTSTSAFGTSSPATVTSGFGFGNATTGSFGQPAFGQPAGFGQASSFGGSGSAGFGTGGSVFGQTASTSASVFGQSTTTTQSSEGGGAFGGGGGLLGGLGGKPSADKANKNVFGGGTFGASNDTQNSTLFGSGGGPSSFGTTSTGVFGSSGGFTASGSGVGSTGFGLSQTPQSPQAGGFGAQPSFGGSPSFGSSTFGGAPAFGSPGGGGFGTTASFPSPVASSTFGSAGPQQAGFASFASGNSPTFGNLAQTGQPSFGGMAQGGGVGGGGGGGGSGGFASNTGFGSPAPSGFGAQPGFGSQQSGFGSSPQFTSYRG